MLLTDWLLDRRANRHRRLFEACLDRADNSLRNDDDAAAANWLHVAAVFADAFPCGELTSTRLETIVLSLARRLPPAVYAASPQVRSRRWLHVMSIGYPTGGHSALVRRWMERDDSGDTHHLVMTCMNDIDLPDLVNAVAMRGGQATTLGDSGALIEKARRLRALAAASADIVVIHSHMWDIVPTLAFGIPGGPPVLLLNHASHTFWVGASIADLVLNLRQAALDVSARHRGVAANRLFRIPLPAPLSRDEAVVERHRVRTEVGIPTDAIVFLSIGAPYKYTPMGSLDFPAMTERLLRELPTAYLLAIGPSPDDAHWRRAIAESSPRLLALGSQPQPMARFHAAADIYLDGFPFDSHTALLEAALSGLPGIRIPACAVMPFSGNDHPLSALQQPADVEEYLTQCITLARSPQQRQETGTRFHEAVANLNGPAGWRVNGAEFTRDLPTSHRIHRPTSTPLGPTERRFWVSFQQRVNPLDPDIFLRHHANLLGLPADLVPASRDFLHAARRMLRAFTTLMPEPHRCR
jgi:hypothetical protein